MKLPRGHQRTEARSLGWRNRKFSIAVDCAILALVSEGLTKRQKKTQEWGHPGLGGSSLLYSGTFTQRRVWSATVGYCQRLYSLVLEKGDTGPEERFVG